MVSDRMPVEWQSLRQRAQRARVCYEIFPVITYQPLDAPVDWFEVALQAEADLHQPLDCPEGREAIAVLNEIAAFLARRIPADVSPDLSLSAWYYTARPGLAGESLSATRLFRSLSLVVCNIPPYLKSEELPLLNELKLQLGQLDIPRLEAVH